MDDIRWSIRSLRMFLKHYGSQGEDQIICISEVYSGRYIEQGIHTQRINISNCKGHKIIQVQNVVIQQTCFNSSVHDVRFRGFKWVCFRGRTISAIQIFSFIKISGQRESFCQCLIKADRKRKRLSSSISTVYIKRYATEEPT